MASSTLTETTRKGKPMGPRALLSTLLCSQFTGILHSLGKYSPRKAERASRSPTTSQGNNRECFIPLAAETDLHQCSSNTCSSTCSSNKPNNNCSSSRTNNKISNSFNRISYINMKSINSSSSYNSRQQQCSNRRSVFSNRAVLASRVCR